MPEEINVDEILKRILEEEDFVKSQSLNYQEYLPEFIAKAMEDLAIIEENVLILEKESNNTDSINAMFRSFHNIKGSSGFVGQDAIQKIAHQTETLLDGCRKGRTIISNKAADLILQSADFIKKLCEEMSLNQDESFLEQVYSHLRKIESEDNNNIDAIIEGHFNIIDDSYNEFFNEFVIEAKSHLESIENYTLQLENTTTQIEIIHIIFRDFHSIKGLAGFAGQVLIQRISHETETLLDKCRKENLIFNKNVVDLILKSVDFIKRICEAPFTTKQQDFLECVYNHIKAMENEEIVIEAQNEAIEEAVDDEFLQDFIVEATEHLENIESLVIDLEKNTSNEEIIHSMFRSFHTIKGLAGFVNQNLVQKIAHQTETLMDSCRKGKIEVSKEIIDLILNSADNIKKICNNIDLTKNREFIIQINSHLQTLEYFELQTVEIQNTNNKKIGEILVEQKIIKQQEVKEVLEKQKTEYTDLKFGEIVVKEEKAKPQEIIQALKQQNKQSSTEEYMRISTNKVDSLVDMVGELMIAQSLIDQYATSKYATDSFFTANLGRMTRITKDLQNISMFLRMVSLKPTFQKITRIARDTINELGKNINFSTSGEETEIDRIVTERLLDPLVHLVKNAISHGIEETDEERIKEGKSPQGNVTVNAYNKRGSIYIEISDDGKGINTDIVYKKAFEKGLIDPNKEYSEKEIQEFILLPGFSTLEVANNISGRGVGMDVVKTEILKAGGKVEIKSTKGQGSVFILKIPVNHAVMNGTIVDIEGSNYIIPTVNVKKILQPKEEQWISVQGTKSMIKVRNDIIQLLSISKLFKTGKEAEEPKLAVIIELDQKFKALPVRNVIGRQEIVVKPAGKEFASLNFISGMSILGDGKVSLILDIECLFETEGAI